MLHSELLYGKKFFLENADIRTFGYEGMKKPSSPFLFKHYSVCENSFNVLKNNEFYVSHPGELNDLFDFNIFSWDIEVVEKELFIEEVKRVGAYPSLIELYDSDKKHAMFELLKIYYLYCIQKTGMLSTTSDELNELFWSYYGNNQGFQMQIDYSKLPLEFKGPFKMNYVEEIERLNLSKLDFTMVVLAQAVTKKDIWKPENEYRFLYDAGCKTFKTKFPILGFDSDSFEYDKVPIKRTVTIAADVFKSITLGFRYFDGGLEREGDKLLFHKSKKDEIDFRFEILKKVIEKKIPVKVIAIRGLKMQKIDADLSLFENDKILIIYR